MTDNQNPDPKPDETSDPEAVERLLERSSVSDTYAWFEDSEVDDEGIAAAPATTVVGIDRETYEELGEPSSITISLS